MNIEKPPRSLWPVAIIGFFVLAGVFLAGFVVWAGHQREDLVADNYYDNEVRFQLRLDELNRTQPLGARVRVSYDAVQQNIVVALPAAQARAVAGRIFLYRPSDARLDRDLPLAVNAAGVQCLDARQLPRGLWKVRVQWAADGQEYFLDRQVVVTAG